MKRFALLIMWFAGCSVREPEDAPRDGNAAPEVSTPYAPGASLVDILCTRLPAANGAVRRSIWTVFLHARLHSNGVARMRSLVAERCSLHARLHAQQRSCAHAESRG